MRIFYSITILLFCLTNTLKSQAPDWAWARSGEGGIIGVQGFSVCNDANGNVYATGSFSRPFAVFGLDTLTSTANNSVFIAKYDASGSEIWAKSSIGTGNDVAHSISTDASGNIYITGAFESPTITFGGVTLANTNTTFNSGYRNIFIVKYDPLGNVMWAKCSTGQTALNTGYNIKLDNQSNVYLVGSFNDTIAFDLDTLVNTGVAIMFIAKYDSLGNVLWTKSAGGSGTTYGQAISLDQDDNFLVTGEFFGAFSAFDNDTLWNSGTNVHSNVFVARYNAAGSVLWAKAATGVGYGYGMGISSDLVGNAYITGYSDSSFIAFGSDTLTNVDSINNIFIVKYDSSGNVLWAKGVACGGSAAGYYTATNVNGIYLTGSFLNRAVFGGDTLSGIGDYNAFIAKYDTSGNVMWANSSEGICDAWSQSISLDANSNAYIAGFYGGDNMIFGNDTLPGTGANGTYNLFVAKLIDYPTGISTITSSNHITIYPNPSNGTFYFSGVQSGATVEVYNVLGEMIYTGKANTDNYPVSLSGQAKGIYFYKVWNSANTLQEGKIILE